MVIVYLQGSWKKKVRDRLKFLRRPVKNKKSTSTHPVDSEEDITSEESLEIKLTSLKSECEKRKRERSMALIQDLTTATYRNRRHWIQQKQPHVHEILEKYPSIKIRKMVSVAKVVV